MKERPILMSAPMVCATLDDRKTQTRRVMKSQPVDVCHVIGFSGNNWGYLQQTGLAIDDHVEKWIPCPYEVGMRLWVRETWHHEDASCFDPKCGQPTHIFYRVTEPYPESIRWRPSIFMPRWASRITLEITDVRVQRVQEISYEDQLAEGFEVGHPAGPLHWFQGLFDFLNKKRGYSWASDPWVWVIEFRRITI